MSARNLGLIALAAVSLCSCASLAGNGNYQYAHVAQDGTSCTLKVDSGRTVQGGVDLSLDKECGVTLKTGDIGQGQSQLGAIMGFTAGMIGVVTGKPVAIPVQPTAITATSAEKNQ